MRLATLKDGTRDGMLAVVSEDGAAIAPAASVAPTLQAALDDWARCESRLRTLARDLQRGAVRGEPVIPERLHAPLPRAYEWVDGSAYLNHIRLVRKARGAEIPTTLETNPLVYQGGSGVMLPPREPLPLANPDWGLDFEGEVCAILGDVPQGTGAGGAATHVRLLCLANDVTYRNLVPAELAKGFGFFQSKPATAFSPFVATPDELGSAWHDGRVHLRLEVVYNGRQVGDCEAGEMHFSFFDLVQHIARTRAFTAGTILGSGTVSNADRARGVACLAELRMREIIDAGPGGSPRTPFMSRGDRIELDMRDARGRSVFGRIVQEVV